MIKVKETAKGLNVPFKGHTLGTLEGDNLKKYIKAHLNSKKPDVLLKYFDNTIEELEDFASNIKKKAIKKPEITDENAG